MKVKLNIGLARNDGKGLNAPEPLQAVLAAGGLFIESAKVEQSSTEPTLVVEGKANKNLDGLLCLICENFSQDCIAWQDENGNGHLSGAGADKWAPFNPEFWVD